MQDFSGGDLRLPVVPGVSTGMTYGEIKNAISVGALEAHQVGYFCSYEPEPGYVVSLFFDANSDDAVLTSAQIYIS